MIDLRFTPIDTWPQEPTKNRQRARFTSSGSTMYDDLERELEHLGASDITVQGFFTRQQIRNDGWPYSNAAPIGPGIILSFMSKKLGPMRWACDTFTEWHQNLRAIGMTLQRLRLIDEYGCTKRGEQYRGWSALPPASGAVTPAMSVEQACEWIAAVAGLSVVPSSPQAVYRDAYRAAARKCHPDTGGTTERFKQLQEVARVLDQHWKEAA